MSIYDQLKNEFKGAILTSEEALAGYSKDASLFEIKPQAVAIPLDRDDLKNLVAFVCREKKNNPALSLTVRAGGTDMTGGPLSESIVVDMKNFNRVVDFNEEDKVITVEPGMFYRDFEKVTLEKDLLLPSFPASREMCTLGGMVANNSAGEQTLAYGKTEKYVVGLKAILADGNEYEIKPLSEEEFDKKLTLQGFEGDFYRSIYNLLKENEDLISGARPIVSKNSAGYYLWNVKKNGVYDLTQLFVGSQGTLGIISEVSFKLIKPKKYTKLVVIFLRDLENLGEIVNDILKAHPKTLETYDSHTLKIALRYFPVILKRMHSSAFSLGWKFLPELKMLLTGGLPKEVLTCEVFGHSRKEVDEQAKDLAEKLKERGLKVRVTKSDKEADKYRIIRRESYNLLRQKVQGKKTAPFIDDVIVPPAVLPEFLPKLESLLDVYEQKYGLVYTIAGHIGDGNFHIIPLADLKDEQVREAIPVLMDKVYELVLEYNGSLTAEHNDGLIRTPYLAKMYGEEVYSLFVKVKEIFDEQNIFNPGKKVNGDLDYALSKMRKE